MGALEPWHIIVILFAILLLFGGKKIPELMRGLGKGMKEFKDAQNGETTSQPTNTNSGAARGSDDKPRV